MKRRQSIESAIERSGGWDGSCVISLHVHHHIVAELNALWAVEAEYRQLLWDIDAGDCDTPALDDYEAKQ